MTSSELNYKRVSHCLRQQLAHYQLTLPSQNPVTSERTEIWKELRGLHDWLRNLPQFGPSHYQHPYNLDSTSRNILEENFPTFMVGAQGLPARLPDDCTKLYRLSNISHLTISPDAHWREYEDARGARDILEGKTKKYQHSQLVELSRKQAKEAISPNDPGNSNYWEQRWLPLERFIGPTYTTWHSLSFWTDNVLHVRHVVQEASHLGLASDSINGHPLLIRTSAEFNHSRLRIPNDVDAFEGPIFFPVPHDGSTECGVTVDVAGLLAASEMKSGEGANCANTSPGHKEYVLPPIPVEHIEILPFLLDEMEEPRRREWYMDYLWEPLAHFYEWSVRPRFFCHQECAQKTECHSYQDSIQRIEQN